MAKKLINIGTSANDGTGDKIRIAFGKSNDNFTELYDDVTDLQTSLDSKVSSVNTLTGAVSLDTSNVPDTTNKRYQTDNQNTRNDATSSIQTQLNSKQATLGFTPENVSNKENTTLDTSSTKYPTNNLVKTYTDSEIAAKVYWTKTGNDISNNNSGNVGVGNFNCSSVNVNGGTGYGYLAFLQFPNSGGLIQVGGYDTKLYGFTDSWVVRNPAIYYADYTSLMQTDRHIPDIGKVNSLIGASTTPDATTSIKGKIKLANDLKGSADLPIVNGINGVALGGLATGILKNTTTTGVPSIAVAADFPTLNQNTTGNAATVTTNANLTGVVTSTGNATAIANGVITNAMLANSAVANLSGTNTGNQTSIVGITGTKAQYNTSVTDGDFLYVGDVVDATTSVKGIVRLTNELGGTASSPTINNASVIGKLLTGYVAGAGVVSSSDSIIGAVQKLDGNIANYVAKSSPTTEITTDLFTVGGTNYPISGTGLLQVDDANGLVYVGDKSIAVNGTYISVNDSAQTISFIAANGVTVGGSRVLTAGVANSTTVVLTSATLNSIYPTASTGFKVYCTSIVAGKMIYEKAPSGWVGYACIVP